MRHGTMAEKVKKRSTAERPEGSCKESPGSKEACPEKEEGVGADARKGGLAQAARKADRHAVARGRQGREGGEEGAQGNRKALWRRAETVEGGSQPPRET